MAIALVGSAGAISTASAATITPAFGQATTSGNLLVARVGSNVGAPTAFVSTATPGWVKAIGTSPTGTTTTAQTTIFYKVNCGASETAPTFTCTGATVMYADLIEFSGVATTSALDQTGALDGLMTTTTTGNDTNTSDVAVGCVFFTGTKSATYTVTNTWEPTGGTTVAAQSTAATKAITGFNASAYLLSGFGGSIPDKWFGALTPSTGFQTTNGTCIVIATFKPAAPAAATSPGGPRVVLTAVSRASTW